MSILRVACVIFGLCLTGAAGWFGIAEYRAILQYNTSPSTFFINSDAKALQLISTRAISSNQKQMLFCLNRQNDTRNLLSGVDVQRGFAQACLIRTENILSTSPSRSIAHLERADALHRLGQNAEALDALARAQTTGAYEGWVASVKVV